MSMALEKDFLLNYLLYFAVNLQSAHKMWGLGI